MFHCHTCGHNFETELAIGDDSTEDTYYVCPRKDCHSDQYEEIEADNEHDINY